MKLSNAMASSENEISLEQWEWYGFCLTDVQNLATTGAISAISGEMQVRKLNQVAWTIHV